MQPDLIARSIIRRWREGLRGDELHLAVRADFPDCPSEVYGAAAAAAWAEMRGATSDDAA